MRTARFLPLAVLLAGAAACGDDAGGGATAARDEPEAATVLRLSVAPSPGQIRFDKRRLRAKAGAVVLELENPVEIGHNVRIQTGAQCCFRPGSRDVGGTETIGKGVTRAKLRLEPGRYAFLCSIGGHWQRGQRGTLVVD